MSDEQAGPNVPRSMAGLWAALAAHDYHALPAGCGQNAVKRREISGMVERYFGPSTQHLAFLPVQDACPLRPLADLGGVERGVPAPWAGPNVDDLADPSPFKFM